jgi:hypothetical protein
MVSLREVKKRFSLTDRIQSWLEWLEHPFGNLHFDEFTHPHHSGYRYLQRLLVVH